MSESAIESPKQPSERAAETETRNMDDVIMIEEDAGSATDLDLDDKIGNKNEVDDSIIDLDNDEDIEMRRNSASDKKDICSILARDDVEKVKLPFNDVDDLSKFLDDQFKKLDIDSMIDKALDSLVTNIRKQEQKKFAINRIFSDCDDALLRTERDLALLEDLDQEIDIPSGSDSDDDIQIIAASGVARKRTTPVKAYLTAPVQQIMPKTQQPQYKLIVNNSTGQAILQPIGGAGLLSRQEMVSILSQTNLMNQVKHLQQAAPIPAEAAGQATHVHLRKQQFPPTSTSQTTQPTKIQQQILQQPQRPALQYNQLQHKEIDLAVGMKLYGKKNNEIWYKGTLLDMYHRDKSSTERRFKLKFDGKGMKVLDGKTIALGYPPASILPVGSRIIALYKEEGGPPSFYAGIAAESPSFRNSNRYLIFFDDGYAQYCDPSEVRKVVEQSRNVWEDVHPDSQEFIKKYLHQYPERPMVKLQRGQRVKTEWNGIWWNAFVEQVDASLVKMYFDADKRTEWIYRGSTRLEPLYTELANAEVSKQGGKGARRHHGANIKSTKAPYVEYLRNYEDDVQIVEGPWNRTQVQHKQQMFNNMLSSHRSTQFGQVPDPNYKKTPTARKSSASAHQSQPTPKPMTKPKNVQGHVQGRDIVSILQERLGTVGKDEESLGSMIEVNRKNFPATSDRLRYKQHACGPKCLKEVVDDPVKFKGNNPLLIPMLCGWERQVAKQGNTGRRIIFYRTPCGRRLRTIEETDRYLMATDSQLTIDLFCFDQQLSTHCEFVPIKTFCDIKDLSYGKEAVPISCVNGIDRQYPDYVQYSNQRMPGKGVHLNTDSDYLCGCDCTDGCRDPTKCKCIQMSIQAKRAAVGMSHKPDSEVGYQYRRLVDQLITGIYECNPQCGCDSRCHNRVAQNSLALRLQVFKTEKRGWGLRCLDDIPAGGFICIYAGQLLTEQGANEDGQQYGDEYLAELDYVEVVEKMKEGYESDVEDPDKEEESSSESDAEEEERKVEDEEEEEEAPRDSDSDSNFSLHHHQGGTRKRRRAVKARPMSSQQKTQQWIHNLPNVQQQTAMHGCGQPTVRSILAQVAMPGRQFINQKKVSQDAIVISDEEDLAQTDGQHDGETITEEERNIVMATDHCSSCDLVIDHSLYGDCDKAFDSVGAAMAIDFDEAPDSVESQGGTSDDDSINSWKLQQYDGPTDVKRPKMGKNEETSRRSGVSLISPKFDNFILPQFDGPPDDKDSDKESDKDSDKTSDKEGDKESEKESIKESDKDTNKHKDTDKVAGKGANKDSDKDKQTGDKDDVKSAIPEVDEDKKDLATVVKDRAEDGAAATKAEEEEEEEGSAAKSIKSEEEAMEDLETDLPDECLLNTAEGDDFFTDEKSQDSADETQGIANLTITEPTSLNPGLEEEEEDEERDEENTSCKRTTRSQTTSRFVNLPNPEEAAKQQLEEHKQKCDKPGTVKVRSYREMLSEDFCYVMDAKSMGNLGRYLNHSCAPNVFVQNVFVDTHDLRFPWVAFFAAQYIRAGTELTWDYNYDVGSVPGKVLYCYCGATECRGRLL